MRPAQAVERITDTALHHDMEQDVVQLIFSYGPSVNKRLENVCNRFAVPLNL